MIVIGFSLLTVSCDKNLLNVKNPNQQTTATFWKTPQQAQEGVNAVYGSMLLDGGYLRMTQTTEDLRSDDSEANSPWILMTNTGDFSLNATSLSVQLIWLTYYQGIFRANQVFAHVPQIQMDQKTKDELLGQTHFLRGFYYFNLLKFYHNVPLVLHVTKSPKQYDVAQAPPDSVWAQIDKDLQQASTMLPLKWSGNDVGRATKGAAEAYLGKAYLFQKKYKLAAAEFKKVIDSGEYGLMKNYGDNFTSAHQNNKESIWEIQFSKMVGGTDVGWGGPPQPTWGQTQARSVTYAPQGFGWADIQATPILLHVFQKDTTVNGMPDPRLRASLFYNYKGDTLYHTTYRKQYGDSATAVYWKKYEDYNQPNEYPAARSGINIRAMRYSDVLLMYAECLNDMGQTQAAYKYIDMVRNRAHLPLLINTKPNMDQQQMMDQIAHERYLELCGEGHRFDDIVRWGWLYNKTKLAWLQKRDPEFKGWVPGREYLPIPQSELDVNPKLKQNPGYGS